MTRAFLAGVGLGLGAWLLLGALWMFVALEGER